MDFSISSICSQDIALQVLAIALILRYPLSPYSRAVQKVLENKFYACVHVSVGVRVYVCVCVCVVHRVRAYWHDVRRAFTGRSGVEVKDKDVTQMLTHTCKPLTRTHAH